MIALGSIPGGGPVTPARGVSADGEVVIGFGESGDGALVVGYNSVTTEDGPSYMASIWDDANGMRALDELLNELGVDLTGWTLQEAQAISDDGLTIVGHGVNPSGFVEAWVAVIPEPASSWLAVAALLTLSGLRRRQKRLPSR